MTWHRAPSPCSWTLGFVRSVGPAIAITMPGAGAGLISLGSGLTTHKTDDSVAHVFTWVDIAHVLTCCPHPCPLTILSASSHGPDTCGALSQCLRSQCPPAPSTTELTSHFHPPQPAPVPGQAQSSSRLWREINITRTRPGHVDLSTGLCEISQCQEEAPPC